MTTFQMDEGVARRHLRQGNVVVIAEVIRTVCYYDDGYCGTGQLALGHTVERTVTLSTTRELDELIVECFADSDPDLFSEGSTGYSVGGYFIDMNV